MRMYTHAIYSHITYDCTLGLALGLAFGLLVATVDFALDWAGGLGLAFADEEATFDCTLGLDVAAVFDPLGLGLDLAVAFDPPDLGLDWAARDLAFSCSLALSTASRPIKLPVTYEGCALTRGA